MCIEALLVELCSSLGVWKSFWILLYVSASRGVSTIALIACGLCFKGGLSSFTSYSCYCPRHQEETPMAAAYVCRWSVNWTWVSKARPVSDARRLSLPEGGVFGATRFQACVCPMSCEVHLCFRNAITNVKKQNSTESI